MHTRYSPVRRSSSMYCYIMLPLDLHVLSLPLAFILSQDQTLHCKNLFLNLFTKNNPVNSIQNTNKLIFDEISISRLVVYFIISKNFFLYQLPADLISLYFWDDKDNVSIFSSKEIDIFFPTLSEINLHI